MKKLLFLWLAGICLILGACNTEKVDGASSISWSNSEDVPLALIQHFTGFLDYFESPNCRSTNGSGWYPRSLKTWKLNSGYRYEYSFSGELNCFGQRNGMYDHITITFDHPSLISADDIQKTWSDDLFIPKLAFSGYAYFVEQEHFRLECHPWRTPYWFSFPSGSWEFIAKDYILWRYDLIVPYINYASWELKWQNFYSMFPHPESEDDIEGVSYWKENCVIEIWTGSNFPELPIKLGTGSENMTVAFTREKSQTSKCKQWHYFSTYFPYETFIEFSNENTVCTLHLDKDHTVREFSMGK